MNEEIPVNSMNLTPEQILEMFLPQWDGLALSGYTNYLKSGRGCFYVDLRMILMEKGMVDAQFAYVPRNNQDWLASKLGDQSQEMIATYDPEKMVLLMIHLVPDRLIGMFMGTNDGLVSP